ncbi:MAG: serine/threonine-protein kinase [Chloroflexota bacterium]
MSNQAITFNRLLQVGDQFDQFQIQAHIAQGGMSDIYRAYDLVRRRDVAIKIPHQSMLGDPAQYERFQRELEIMNSLKHPVILSGLGSGQYNRIPYLVMEYIDGESLRKLLDSASPLTSDHALALVRKIADGLAYCHTNNVVHRDLKPENILITSEGQPVIMDFGLALTKSAHRVTYSNLSETMGTPDYMAPEQIEGHRGDQRTDMYALGIIFFELLAGEPPFTGDSNMAVMAQHLHNTAPRLDHINPAIPIELAATVAHCLARNPENRYPDIKTLLYALDHPETVDLAILDKMENIKTPVKTSILQSQTTKAIGISILLMVAIILLALALQSLR